MPPEEGGRVLFAKVPSWLQGFGDCPTHAANGQRNMPLIPKNMPGRRDAGRNWERDYDGFIIGIAQGFTQSVYDLRAPACRG